jgi:hypothetical protein
VLVLHLGVPVFTRSYCRYWREYKTLKRALKRIVRRFTLVPALRLWTDSASTLQRDRRVVTAVQRRTHSRLRRTVMLAWRGFARKSALLRRRAELLTRKTTRRRKFHILMTWLKNVDHKINQDKYHEVVELHNYYLLKRGMFHWHKTALISEMCTWRSSRSAVRNWHLTTRISRKLRHSYERAARFSDAYLVTAYVLLWYRRVARRILLTRRCTKALRLRQLHRYLAYFRKWKRRMYLVYRARNFLSPLQQNTRLFNLQRSLRIWYRCVFLL